MKLCCISDTHGLHRQIATLPDADVLLHAGDLSNTGKIAELEEFADWFRSQPHKHKILIAGNHDFGLEAFMKEGTEFAVHEKLFAGLAYLRDSSVVIEDVKFYGSPWTPAFYDWAFNQMRGPQSAERWAEIPDDVDVLVTHGPPMGILDRVGPDSVGCADLANRVFKIKPRVHVFGHLHCQYGEKIFNGTHFVNAALLDERYRLTNPPIVVEI